MTLPSDIPEDVRRAAIDLADTIILTREADGQSASYAAWLRSNIARAIMVERERAAKVADRHVAVWSRGMPQPAAAARMRAGLIIASAIRNGDAS